MNPCPEADHITRTIGARCTRCGAPMLREPHATGHRKGTPGYHRHVQTEQRDLIAHLQQLTGRDLTPAERTEINDAVAEAIARFSH